MRLGVKVLLAVSLAFVGSVLTFFIVYWILFQLFLADAMTSPVLFNLVTFSAFLIALLVFIFIFFLLILPRLRYIAYLQAQLDQLDESKLGEPLVVRGSDELADLATSINAMSTALKEKIEHERKQEKLKNELITNLSHDLRSPLTVILGYLRLLRDQQVTDPGEQEAAVEKAYDKSLQLEQRVADLFAYAKLSNREIQLAKTKLNLSRMLEQFLDEMTPMIETASFRLKTVLPSTDVWILADAQQLLRVFENLLSNALKYGDPTEPIRITLGEIGDHVQIRFANHLNQPLIGDVSRLFDRLYKHDVARSKHPESSGLGLAIAKSIIELHQGRIWAEAQQQQLNFHILLPNK